MVAFALVAGRETPTTLVRSKALAQQSSEDQLVRRKRTAGINKSEAIRQTAKSLPKPVRPRDVIGALQSQGIEVTSGQVSTVLSSMGMKRRRGGRRKAAVVETVASTITLGSLLAAKKLVSQLGSVDAAKQAVDALAKLA